MRNTQGTNPKGSCGTFQPQNVGQWSAPSMHLCQEKKAKKKKRKDTVRNRMKMSDASLDTA
jgi:hypothetical protein